MLSTVLPYHTALQEIPTGLKALGMTNLVVLTKINDHLVQRGGHTGIFPFSFMISEKLAQKGDFPALEVA